ncbi:PucR family transcriptional regulator [Streptomyces camponoticapitis]|uniref:PucR family transcriptional regulator n=1 Tax=Streptomyces camponoticapitis TaxID=1616125 RepID=A0ABQ2E4F1_9ACTN|nr:PucR family transcriptional regulator [Streptomyces camponoticapitis]GGJ88801.1 PucR family transcriptional regulator [Streptomyces camponoticapitis]
MPEPSAPPTPPVPLTALLADGTLGLRLVAGLADDRPPVDVHWVHTSEMADPYPYLLGGELLLTAGVQLTDAHADTYVRRVVEAGAAALGFGVAPVYDTVPDSLVEACGRQGLPLLEIPRRTPFTTVARGVWRLMAEARHRELRRVTEAQQGLAAAAARPDPVPAVLHQLAVRLGGRAVLFAPDGAELHTTGRDPAPGFRTALARLARVVNPPHGTATDTAGGARLAAYALGGGQGLVLGVAASGREAGDHTVTGVAVVLLSLLTAPHQGAAEAARSAALVRLLLGATPGDAAPLLGPGPWTVVHAHGGDTPFAPSALAAALGSGLAESDGTTARVLTDRPVTAQPGWTLGVSAPVAPADLIEADTQARRALRHAEATRAGLVRHRAPGPDALTALVPPEEAAAHARALLMPIADSPALTETLRTWLSLHGSWDRTAVALSVHRNTVRQRVARCATLLETDLDEADVRMELWFALRRL